VEANQLEITRVGTERDALQAATVSLCRAIDAVAEGRALTPMEVSALNRDCRSAANIIKGAAPVAATKGDRDAGQKK
jgi:hypothetical protein